MEHVEVVDLAPGNWDAANEQGFRIVASQDQTAHTTLISPDIIEPIQHLKVEHLGNHNPRLHTDEILIALSSSVSENEYAAKAMEQIPNLKGCDIHSTVILSSVDADTLKKLGMYLTCEPTYEEDDRMYHKK